MAEATLSQVNLKSLFQGTRDIMARQRLRKAYEEHLERIKRNSIVGDNQDMKSQNEVLTSSTTKREKISLDKSVAELKAYLSDQPVPYNLWKDADHNTLVKLVTDVYCDKDGV